MRAAQEAPARTGAEGDEDEPGIPHDRSHGRAGARASRPGAGKEDQGSAPSRRPPRGRIGEGGGGIRRRARRDGRGSRGQMQKTGIDRNAIKQQIQRTRVRLPSLHAGNMRLAHAKLLGQLRLGQVHCGSDGATAGHGHAKYRTYFTRQYISYPRSCQMCEYGAARKTSARKSARGL